ncbi:MAG: CBS domain-containing protein [Deltaproteobacteria bacterium]
MEIPRVVADIMTRKVAVVHEEDNLDRLQEAMNRHGFRHLPVVNGGDKLVGIVSDRDVMSAGVGQLLTGAGVEGVEKRLLSETFIARVMHTSVRTVRPDTPLADAVRILAGAKIGALPVVERDNRLVGMVTAHDFLRLTVQLLEAKT